MKTYHINPTIKQFLGTIFIMLLTINSAWACYDANGNQTSCDSTACDPGKTDAGGGSCSSPSQSEPTPVPEPEPTPPSQPEPNQPEPTSPPPAIEQSPVINIGENPSSPAPESESSSAIDNYVMKYDPWANTEQLIKTEEFKDYYISTALRDPKFQNSFFAPTIFVLELINKFKKKWAKLTPDQQRELLKKIRLAQNKATVQKKSLENKEMDDFEVHSVRNEVQGVIYLGGSGPRQATTDDDKDLKKVESPPKPLTALEAEMEQQGLEDMAESFISTSLFSFHADKVRHIVSEQDEQTRIKLTNDLLSETKQEVLTELKTGNYGKGDYTAIVESLFDSDTIFSTLSTPGVSKEKLKAARAKLYSVFASDDLKKQFDYILRKRRIAQTYAANEGLDDKIKELNELKEQRKKFADNDNKTDDAKIKELDEQIENLDRQVDNAQKQIDNLNQQAAEKLESLSGEEKVFLDDHREMRKMEAEQNPDAPKRVIDDVQGVVPLN